MSIPVPTSKTLIPWFIYGLALCNVFLFSCWRIEIEHVREATEQAYVAQQKCNEEKIEAARVQLAKINELYEKIKQEHESSINELQKLRRKR